LRDRQVGRSGTVEARSAAISNPAEPYKVLSFRPHRRVRDERLSASWLPGFSMLPRRNHFAFKKFSTG